MANFNRVAPYMRPFRPEQCPVPVPPNVFENVSAIPLVADVVFCRNKLVFRELDADL